MSAIEKGMSFFWKNIVTPQDEKRIASQASNPTLGIEEHNDIPYLPDGNPMHLLDVYRPCAASGKLPVIIDVHGGGWMYGTKHINKNYCLELAARGFVVFNINYRLIPEVRFKQQMQDVFSAYKWIGERCESYGGDLDNIFLTGDSAGGNIVALSGVINGNSQYEKDFEVCPTGVEFRAIGATSAVVNMDKGIMHTMQGILLGDMEKSDNLTRYMNFSKIYTGQSIPPFYVVTSRQDFVHSQSVALHEILLSHGAKHRFHDWQWNTKKGLPHVFSVLEPKREESASTIDEMTSYFRRFIKKSSPVYSTNKI